MPIRDGIISVLRFIRTLINPQIIISFLILIFNIIIACINSEKVQNFFQILLFYILIGFSVLAIFFMIYWGIRNRDSLVRYSNYIILSLLIIELVIIGLIFIPPSNCVGIYMGNKEPQFFPSGKFGDIGDITIVEHPDSTIFTYITNGKGPHEWVYKYNDCQLNPQPAQFGGVMYLYPKDNWGEEPGLDIRQGILRTGIKSINWEARSINGDCNVEFVMGGITWKWDGCNKTSVPCPDSMPQIRLGIKQLTTEWQIFSSEDLADLDNSNYKNVIGGFGWVINWPVNQVYLNEDRSGSQNPQNFTIEIRNIRYVG
jgi:hypothetical protein